MKTLGIPKPLALLCWLLAALTIGGCVTAPSSPFSTDVRPSTQTITQGNSATFEIAISSKTDINSNVSFSLAGLSGATVLFNPPALPSTAQTATMTIQTTSSTPTQVYNLTLTMREDSTGVTSSKPLTLTVNPIGTARDFTLSVDQAAFNIAFALPHTVRTTISAFNGFEGDVVLSFNSPTPLISGSGLPVTIHAGPQVENVYSFFVSLNSFSGTVTSPVIATLIATSGSTVRTQQLSITVSSTSTPGA